MPTIEEIKAALSDEAVKSEVIKTVLPDAQKALEASGHIIRTKEQDEAYVNAKVDPLVEVKIKDQIKAVHERYDNDLLELTGERKKPEEKTYDFLKRKISEIKGASKGGDPVDKDQLKKLQDLLDAEKNGRKTDIEALHNDYFKKENTFNVRTSLAGFNIAAPATLSDDDKKDFVARQRGMIERDFLSTYTAKKDNDGNIVYYKGEELQVSNKDGKPLSASDLIAANYATYFAKDSREQKGGGTGGAATEITGSSTKADVMKHLESKGVKKNTKEFTDQYEKLCKEHGIIK